MDYFNNEFCATFYGRLTVSGKVNRGNSVIGVILLELENSWSKGGARSPTVHLLYSQL